MSKEFASYEEVSVYGLDDEVREKLLSQHNECSFIWSTREGWPIGVIMSYLWKNGRFWLTAGAHRHRISAVRRDPRVSIVVTSSGSKLGPGKSATAKGRCIVHEDRETKDWFYPEFSAHLYADAAQAEKFCKFLDSPLRIVLEIVPEKWITYDGVKMFLDQAGQLDESSKTPRQSSDAERLPKELKRRGLV
jgi:general stress protein 26